LFRQAGSNNPGKITLSAVAAKIPSNKATSHPENNISPHCESAKNQFETFLFENLSHGGSNFKLGMKKRRDNRAGNCLLSESEMIMILC